MATLTRDEQARVDHVAELEQAQRQLYARF